MDNDNDTEVYYLTIEEYKDGVKQSSDRATITREEYLQIMYLILNQS